MLMQLHSQHEYDNLGNKKSTVDGHIVSSSSSPPAQRHTRSRGFVVPRRLPSALPRNQQSVYAVLDECHFVVCRGLPASAHGEVGRRIECGPWKVSTYLEVVLHDFCQASAA